MKLYELVLSALRALKAHKLRSFLTLLGVVIGVTTIVGVVGVISGLDAFVKEKVITFAPEVFIIDRFGIIQSQKDFIQALKRPLITYEDFERLNAAGLPHVSQVATRAVKSMKVTAGARHLSNTLIVGSTSNFATLFRFEFEAGRYFTQTEDDMAANLAVVGADVKDELFPGVDPIGRTILIGGLPFRIVGVFPRQGSSIGFSRDTVVCIPIQVYRKNFLSAKDSLQISAQASGGVEGLEEALDEVRSFMRARRHTAFRDPDPFGLLTQDSLQELWKQISQAAFILMLLVSSVSLGVGGIVIMNIMLVSVVERTTEIGIRMALGARKRDIRRQFLLEAAILSLVGGVVGMLLGSFATWVVRVAAGFPAVITPGIVISSIAVSTLIGLAAGFLPARRASNLPVIDALRAE
ncbi:ABC transporter permease [Mesoterricola sediminis]|uniref:Multidrug ABC transporter substrate-binding protein n=1 Tax=Mesoterricola sediminis TaxID=2927980 RepID=A0AA48H9X5_9BACT|nr:ABC transporter permease [Mesoterricola sediminis]BDU78598.1 multidrug ABC transporter substrate-binding protein [Mesoterricola sediminis]